MPKTYCNPLPMMNYQRGRGTSTPSYKGPSYREMADPTVIRWQGRWYLFPSAGMLWQSDDLLNWDFHPIEPFDAGYGPTVAQRGEWLYLTASWDGSAMWRARHPLGPWERMGPEGRDLDGNLVWLQDHNGRPVRWGDSCLFVDDDGAMYCYCGLVEPNPDPTGRWKLRNTHAIFGIRLRDEAPWQFAGPPTRLINFHPEHIWERAGEYNQVPWPPVIEGPWMTKFQGRYYLQYSGCGTEFTNYAVGCYIGETPLGPFTYQKRNPILIHRGGLVNGCGHHSVVQGPGDTLWCFYTTLVGIGNGADRRIAMDPVGFDANGEMFIAGPTETPQYAPGIKADPTSENSPEWVPLSVNQPANASSFAPGRDPSYAVDQHIRTWWQAADRQIPQWLELDLQNEYQVHAARTIFADAGSDYRAGILPGPYQYKIEGSRDAKRWTLLSDQITSQIDRQIAYDTWSPQTARYVRLTITGVQAGMSAGVLEWTLFGPRPAAPSRWP
jgi:xylan 1,4-beta-xylosidase